MATPREELRELIDHLSDETIEAWLVQARGAVKKIEHSAMLDWLAEAEKLQAELYAKYGEFPSSVDILNEIREERLDDLMGSR